MSTRERRRSSSGEGLYDDFADVSDEEVEAFAAEQEAEADAAGTRQNKPGFLNLQTGAGLGLIGVGALYTMQNIGLLPIGYSLATLAALLPWLAGILVILTGLGVLSWNPSVRRRRKARERAAKARQKTMGRSGRSRSFDDLGRRAASAFEGAEKAYRKAEGRFSVSGRSSGRRLAKAREGKKISGVAAGIAHFFGVDPTVIRVLFVLGTIFGSGAAIPLYLILAWLLPKEDEEPTRPGARDPHNRDPFDDDRPVRIVRD